MEYAHVRHADSLGITLPFGAATWTPGFYDTWQPVFRENIADMNAPFSQFDGVVEMRTMMLPRQPVEHAI